MRFRPILTLAMAVGFACAALGAADLTITFAGKGKGQSATEIHYYSADHHLVRGVETRMDSLVDFQAGKTYVIDHKKKTISMISFDDAMAAMDSMNAASPKGLGGMMGAVFGDPNDYKVEELPRETVAGRSCQVWHITVGKLSMTLSADPTLKMPVPDAAYARMIQARAAQFAKAGPMGASFKRLYEEMAKIKGVPLKTHLTGMMGMDSATEATKIEIGPVPAATYALPDGYKLEDEGRKMREQMAKAKQP